MVCICSKVCCVNIGQEELIDENLLLGENGYTLATVQTSVEYLLSTYEEAPATPPADKTEPGKTDSEEPEPEALVDNEAGEILSGAFNRDVSLQEVEESILNELAEDIDTDDDIFADVESMHAGPEQQVAETDVASA